MTPEQPTQQPETPPVAPMPPAPAPEMPPPALPPKKKLSTGALIAIIVGSVAAFIALVSIVFAIIFVPRIVETIGTGTTKDKSALYDEDQGMSSVTSYESDTFTFEYPDSWKQKDTTNQTTIIGGVEPDAYVVILSDDKNSDAIINYTYNKGGAEPVDKARARTAMNTALQTQQAASSSQLVAMRESTGHGCAANAAYTTEPTFQEKGDLIGYTYGFTCESFYGLVQGEYGVWYDAYGGQHRLLVSSLEDYWAEHESDLQAILASATAR